MVLLLILVKGNKKKPIAQHKLCEKQKRSCVVLCRHLLVYGQTRQIVQLFMLLVLRPFSFLGQVRDRGHPSRSDNEDAHQPRAATTEEPADQPCPHGLRDQVHGLLQRELLEEKG